MTIFKNKKEIVADNDWLPATMGVLSLDGLRADYCSVPFSAALIMACEA